MKFFLVRHGEALPSALNPDPPLSPIGREETAKVGAFLAPFTEEIDQVIHSGKKRAKETAEILVEKAGISTKPVEREGLKPNDPVPSFVEDIEFGEQNLLIVGHLPFLEKLVSYLTLQQEEASVVNFAASSLICLEGEGSQWRISWMISPDALR
ncbi:MAG: 2,3-bisphosphoglycerate-dependent phosphoglycerate mutase [Chlamydiae bacterium]|nr:2,3-bisphosphoglycerate-dependent phosphoglycerate mutase [Chlamydiota bacterium]